MTLGAHAEVQPETRSAGRTNMFVIATIYAGDASAPVKIRNLSTTGALVEGAHLPPVPTKISLRRASLQADGEVVWSANGRAGIRFDAPVSVTHWLPGGETRLRQEQVDAIFQEVKSSGAVLPLTVDPSSSAVTEEDVAKVLGLIEALADALAEDEIVVASHGDKLQTLDLAAQVLRRLSQRTM